ncbi:hypothetical protein PIB30_075702 [Stylosanthes scabra]|uniref:Uncharacterized protein n=1 Tax=Stylosanthes scabra TaxID=79078 RepID=A0ABU6XP10_9FABA|nr:hypothetical protein [Stylosanthes scabra]
MHDFIVPDLISSKIIGRKLVFIVDPRPIGYESNISVHIVRAISDDPSIIKIFQDASNINEEKGTNEPEASNALFKCSSSGSPCPEAVTIGEELEARFGKPKIDEPPAKMDETSG